MSEEEKILKTIRYCANDYMKQEDGIQCFEWGDLWVLNEYIKKLQQENKQLKEELQKADSITQSCIFEGKEESTINFRECLNKLKLYKEVIKEVREYITKQKDKPYKSLSEKATICNKYNELLQILDKGVKND